MKKLLILGLSSALVAVALIGCANTPATDNNAPVIDSASIGKNIAAIHQAKIDYCTAFDGSPLRAAALIYLKAKVHELPTNGICDSIFNIETGTDSAITPKARDSPLN